MVLAEIFRLHWRDYQQKYGEQILPSHRAAVRSLLSCHRPEAGGSLYQCEDGHQQFTYHGCGHRACPQCGNRQTTSWIEKQTRRLLPVNYHLVTFTVPQELREPIRSQQRLLLDLLMAESAASLQDVAANPRYLGGELSLLGVLHTWSRQLIYHPHVHYIVPALGLAEGGVLRAPKKSDFLLPVRVLSQRFRNRFRLAWQKADPISFAKAPENVWKKPWVVHSQPVGSGQAALKYLSRYVYRTAISVERALKLQGAMVRFTYRDSKTRLPRQARLPVQEFMRRFLQHILPKRFRRIRSSGWSSPAAKKKFKYVATMLDALPTAQPFVAQPVKVCVTCSHCQKPMHRVAKLLRCRPP